MKKRICDICGKNEANNNYRLQQEKEVASYSTFGFVFPKKEWVDIDICDECFKAISWRYDSTTENKLKTIVDYETIDNKTHDQLVFPHTIGDITFYSRKELIKWVEDQQKMNKDPDYGRGNWA
jgi:uncharacterized OB-fold protein